MPEVNRSNFEKVSPDKLRLRGGRKVEYNGAIYKIGKAQNSTRKGKKYSVEVIKLGADGKPLTKKTVHWGAEGYQDYYIHRDKKRRENFQKRHQAIRKKDGSLAHKDPFSPSYHATKHSWSKNQDSFVNFGYYEYIEKTDWIKIPKHLRRKIRDLEKKNKATKDLYLEVKRYYVN